jgi:murein DD-endopeptidase MepM/ murein hydrolase activator NlpD
MTAPRGARWWPILAAAAVLAGCTANQPPPPVSAEPSVVRQQEPVEPRELAFQGAIVQGGLALGQAPADTVAVTLDGAPVEIDANRRFVIGFGRDAGPFARVVASFRDGTSIARTLTVERRRYDIQHIASLRRRPQQSEAYERLRRAERARIEAARAQRNDSAGWQQRWIWPVTGRISGVYGSQRILGGEPADPHYGVDIARPDGTPIVAPADGVVVLAAPPAFSLEGRLLIIDHGMGINSAYLHLSRIDVAEGQKVGRGQAVGAIGTTGRSTGPHLHWGVNWGNVRIDPALLAGPMPGGG